VQKINEQKLAGDVVRSTSGIHHRCCVSEQLKYPRRGIPSTTSTCYDRLAAIIIHHAAGLQQRATSSAPTAFPSNCPDKAGATTRWRLSLWQSVRAITGS